MQSHPQNRHAVRFPVSPRIDWLPAEVKARDPSLVNLRAPCCTLGRARARNVERYAFREFVTAGGLVSYGAKLADQSRQARQYVARILKGARPADMPVVQASTLELALNLRSAKRLGLAVSRDFLARVDDVMQ